MRAEAERADRETTDVYARQSAISGAADILAEAGLIAESDALLTKELARSHSPYYFMLGLAANAKKRGDKAGALDWAEKAYASAKGPATRLQWGVSYMRTLIATAPEDSARIERVAGQIIGELEATPETFYERNRRSLERLGRELADWNKDKRHDASVQAHSRGDGERSARSCRRAIRRARPATARFVPRARAAQRSGRSSGTGRPRRAARRRRS